MKTTEQIKQYLNENWLIGLIEEYLEKRGYTLDEYLTYLEKKQRLEDVVFSFSVWSGTYQGFEYWCNTCYKYIEWYRQGVTNLKFTVTHRKDNIYLIQIDNVKQLNRIADLLDEEPYTTVLETRWSRMCEQGSIILQIDPSFSKPEIKCITSDMNDIISSL